jgi:hypothetical protein
MVSPPQNGARLLVNTLTTVVISEPQLRPERHRSFPAQRECVKRGNGQQLAIKFGGDAFKHHNVQYWIADLRGLKRSTTLTSKFWPRGNPFQSGRPLGHTLKIDHAGVIRHVEQRFGFHCLNLKRVPPRRGRNEFSMRAHHCQTFQTERGTVGTIWPLQRSHRPSFHAYSLGGESLPQMKSERNRREL